MGASPVVVDDKVILVCDQNIGSFMIAVNKNTGETVWRVDRPEAKSGHSTPITWESPEGETQLLVPGSFLLDAYDPDTGQKLWWTQGLSFEMKSTAVIHNGVAYINGYGSPLNQPGNMVEVPAFADVLRDNDGDSDGMMSLDEMPPSRANNWFGFVDLDVDKELNEAEWEYMRAAPGESQRDAGDQARRRGRHDRAERRVGVQPRRAAAAIAAGLQRHPLYGERRRRGDLVQS